MPAKFIYTVRIEKEKTMKKFAVAAALLSAVVATPALAQNGEGHVEVRGGYITGSGLDDATLAELARTDALELIYLHLQSMNNLNGLAGRTGRKATAPAR